MAKHGKTESLENENGQHIEEVKRMPFVLFTTWMVTIDSLMLVFMCWALIEDFDEMQN